MFTEFITQGIFLPFDEDAQELNQSFRENPNGFNEFAKTVIKDMTISNLTWQNLDDEVKEELTRLGYKHE